MGAQLKSNLIEEQPKEAPVAAVNPLGAKLGAQMK